MERRARRDPYKLVGTTLGKYHIQELVGIGGMGVVYRAQHVTTEGTVAVKVLKPDLAFENPDMVQFFFEEAKKTLRLNHPCIIKVTDADVAADDLAFLVMEWLEGRTLEDELKERGTLTLERITVLLEQVCDGMTEAHARGIVHRDLKPGNIMIAADYKGNEVVKILDFGIAKALNSSVGATSRVLGAPYYASPEQLVVSASIDHRSDIYSLGVMIYQLLTGKLPFDADSMGQIVYQHLNAEPQSLRQFRAEIPEAVEEVVLRALSKKPEGRYENMTELARAFRQAASLGTGAISLWCVDSSSRAGLAGATIYLDGKYAGETDERGGWLKEGLAPKEHVMEIECLQYQPWKKRVRINAREEMVATAELLRKEAGELIVRTTVAGAEVLLDRKKVGTTDKTGTLHLHDLPLGKVRVEVKHPNKRAAVASEVQIMKGQPASLEVELPAPARFKWFKGLSG